jgi:GrpB-like predicted nucleotidyltransferase (UPF0157 family)
MLGLQRGTIRIVPADPEWALVFAEEEARLRASMGLVSVNCGGKRIIEREPEAEHLR